MQLIGFARIIFNSIEQIAFKPSKWQFEYIIRAFKPSDEGSMQLDEKSYRYIWYEHEHELFTFFNIEIMNETTTCPFQGFIARFQRLGGKTIEKKSMGSVGLRGRSH